MLAAAFSPDGRYLATSGHGGEADIWNVEARTHARSLLGHSQPVPQIAWSHDGDLVATASSDGSVRIWDPSTGKDLAAIPEPAEIVEVQWSRDDRTLYTASTNGGFGIIDVRRETRTIDELRAFMTKHTPTASSTGSSSPAMRDDRPIS